MNFNKLFFILILLSLIGVGYANNYGIWLHTIDISVDTLGDAKISEKFHLYFPTDQDKIDFRNKSSEFGSNLNQWKEFNETFTTTIGLNNVVKGAITYSEGEDNYLELRYELADELMSRGKETTLVEEYSIKANYLNKLYQSGLWIIPDNTKVTIELPPGADIKDNISPDALLGMNATRRTITWNGYKSANQLTLKYVIWKKINPIIDLNKFSDFLFRTSDGAIIIFISLIIIGAIIWKRKFFGQKIETFIENNSKFEEE